MNPADPGSPATPEPAVPEQPQQPAEPAVPAQPGLPAARSVQATVATFDPASGAGSVLLDDGRPVEFDGAAFAAGGLRLLRFGQRVRLEYAGDRVARVTIHTLA